MYRFVWMLIGGLAWLAAMPAAGASEFSGRVTLTSEYIFRGLAMSGSDPALQLGLDYEHDSGLFAGMWGSTIDIPGTGGDLDHELDFYAGYHHQFRLPVSATVTLLRYTFPGQGGGFDYDYTELLLGATWGERYSIELGFIDDLYGHGSESRHIEVHGEWPLLDAWVLGATLGRNDVSYPGASPYYYWDVGASARFARLVVDLRWFDNEHIYRSFGPQPAGSQLVVSLSVPF